ncbi:MAG: quinoprotein dehydrogenase-associated SoxYZ-like carrier [Chromatiaceae bacterium]|jgi:sulfur-oxidizing protein SoxY|nr:quinoprotein dehydrogenase-associated SoxYZ-like carrier [Chromatiaceae bacterium]
MTPVSESAHPSNWRGLTVLALTLLTAALAANPWPASAEGDDARWGQIKSALFGDRAVQDGQNVIGLETPYRALDAAVVPVEIKALKAQTPDRFIKNLYLVIDMNPSPVAGVFHFPRVHDWNTLSTRVRVNAYTHIRAIAETSDGGLYMAANYVKASGGCSAPSLKDPAAAQSQRGRMKLLLPDEPRSGNPITAQILIKHPNSSGLQFDQVSRQIIPADFVKTIEVSYRGEPLFSVDSDISLSEDPSLRFNFIPASTGDLTVRVTDSNGHEFEERFGVAAAEAE